MSGRPHFDVNKLALFSTLLVLVSDFLVFLIAYQEFVDSKTSGGTGNNIRVEEIGRRLII